KECLDCWWRWMGLRHRLWRTRSRNLERPQHKPTGTRYRGLLQYWRTSIEVYSTGGSGEIRGGWQAGTQEGSRADGDELRPCVCRQRGHGSEGRAHLESLPGSGGL